MIFVENDFYLNFKNAVKSNDETALRVIFIDQISNLLAKNRGDIISLFQKVGIKTSENPSNEELVNKIVENIKKSAKLRAGLSFLISKQNDLLVSSDKSERKSESTKKDSESESEQSDVDYEKSADTVTFIATSLNAIAETLKNEKLNSFQKSLIEKTNVKAPNYSGKAYETKKPKNKTSKKKSNKWIWIALGVTALGVTIYAYKKGMFKKNIDVNV